MAGAVFNSAEKLHQLAILQAGDRRQHQLQRDEWRSVGGHEFTPCRRQRRRVAGLIAVEGVAKSRIEERTRVGVVLPASVDVVVQSLVIDCCLRRALRQGLARQRGRKQQQEHRQVSHGSIIVDSMCATCQLLGDSQWWGERMASDRWETCDEPSQFRSLERISAKTYRCPECGYSTSSTKAEARG